MTSGTRGKRSHAAGESKPGQPTNSRQGESKERNRTEVEERREKWRCLNGEKERKREKERETGHRLTGFIVEPNDHACVRFFFFFFFFFFFRGIDEENAHAKYAEERDNRSSKLFTLDEEIVIVVSSPFTIY